jgi:hypothetical protein
MQSQSRRPQASSLGAARWRATAAEIVAERALTLVKSYDMICLKIDHKKTG